MNASNDTKIVNALPTRTVISYTALDGCRFAYKRQVDGRWTGSYICNEGASIRLCANGFADSLRVASALANATGITFHTDTHGAKYGVPRQGEA